ncbi:hypothetical protein Tco_0749545 [Tanacetum coccineum]|uniref:Uncharacterized protein n=1 Tax=Tanacetum coccineum TaxID=301880 RepID=A0ABQ4YYQ8_9ASTR
MILALLCFQSLDPILCPLDQSVITRIASVAFRDEEASRPSSLLDAPNDHGPSLLPIIRSHLVSVGLKDKEKGIEKKSGGTRKKTLARKRAGEKKSEESSKRQKNKDAADYEQEKADKRKDEIEIVVLKVAQWDEDVGGKDFEVYKLTRADGSASYHRNIQAFLGRLDREDLNWKFLKWKLHENYGIHTLFMDGTPMQINMLVEKKYSLIKDLLEKMLNLQLEAKEESTIAFELLKYIKSQIEEQ